MILAGITLDATNLGIIGTTIAAVGGAYAHSGAHRSSQLSRASASDARAPVTAAKAESSMPSRAVSG